MLPLPKVRLNGGRILALMAALITFPALAETANFGSLTLSRTSPTSTAVLTGSTGGSFSLSAVANKDVHHHQCFGFAAPTPDHILVLQEDFSSLALQVNSGGKDTTLLIQGPNDSTVRCGDDTGQSKDASVVDSDWKAGSYRIWVGSLEAGVKYNYTLSVKP